MNRNPLEIGSYISMGIGGLAALIMLYFTKSKGLYIGALVACTVIALGLSYNVYLMGEDAGTINIETYNDSTSTSLQTDKEKLLDLLKKNIVTVEVLVSERCGFCRKLKNYLHKEGLSNYFTFKETNTQPGNSLARRIDDNGGSSGAVPQHLYTHVPTGKSSVSVGYLEIEGLLKNIESLINSS